MATDDNDIHADRGPAAFAVTTATLVLSFVFVAARTGCRVGLVRHVGWDDYFIVLAWLLALGLGAAIAVATRHGLGRHDSAIATGDRGVLHRCEYVFSILYNPALMATKTSILIFYLRLARTTQPLLRLGSFAVLAIGNVAGAVLTLLNIFQCRPLRAGFADDATARCIPLLTEFVCSAPVNIVTDLAILALPLPVLTGMRLPSRQKTILVLTFALGVFVAVVDVVRIYYLQQAVGATSQTSAMAMGGGGDDDGGFGGGAEFAWHAALAFMWSAVEVNVGIICACIPTLKPLIIRILPAMLVDPDGGRGSGSSGGSGGSGSGSGSYSNKPPGHAREISSGGLSLPLSLPATDAATAVVDPSSTTLVPSLAGHLQSGHHSGRQSGQHHHHHHHHHHHLLRRRQKQTYFGFINIERPKNMLDVSATASLRYCTTVAVLFFLWGFSYGLLNTLNDAVAAVADMTRTQTLGLTSAYFGGGYLFGPLLIGVWVLRHDEHRRREHAAVHRLSQHTPIHTHGPSLDPVGGFKATFMVGLCIYGVGTIMFWPCAVLASFPGFLISSFVVGFGLSVLETAANPFLVLCGPPAYAEMRLLVAQGAQGVASVLSGLLAQNVFTETGTEAAEAAEVTSASSTSSSSTSSFLLDIQWTYLAVTLLCVALALFFYYMPLPEVRDADLVRAQENDDDDNDNSNDPLWWRHPRNAGLVLAIFAQWTYTAAQECMSTYFHPLLVSWVPGTTTTANADAAMAAAAAALHPRMAATGLDPDPAADHPAGLALSVPNSLLVCRSAFAVSRFLAAGLVYAAVQWPASARFLGPRPLLFWSTALTALCALLLVVLPAQSNANTLLIPIALFFFAEGPIWPLVFALGLRGQGPRTKRAAAYITMGASGPLFWPFVLYAVAGESTTATTTGRSRTQIAFIVVVALAAATTVYPLYLSLNRGGRRLSRVVPKTQETKDGDEEAAGGQPDGNRADPATDTGAGAGSSSRDAQGTRPVPGVLNIYPGQ